MAAAKGKPFTLGDQTFLFNQMSNVEPMTAIREAIVNSREAGASSIEIFAGTRSTNILDNGSGMSSGDLQQYLTRFGAGAKHRGREGNMGIGLKASTLLIPAGIRVTSWTARSAPSQIMLGRLSENEFGPLFLEGESVIRSVRLPSVPRNMGVELGKAGTLVELVGFPYEPYKIIRFLNGRMLQFEEPEVRVWRSGEEERKPMTVEGVLPLMQKICSSTGRASLKHCTLHWGIRSDLSNQGKVDEPKWTHRVWQPEMCYIAWRGETFRSYQSHRGGIHHMAQYGIPSGAKFLILVVEAKGSRISPDMHRWGISGWDEDDAADEVRDNLPREIIEFMARFEADHFDEETTSLYTTRLLLDLGFVPAMLRGSGDLMSVSPDELGEEEPHYTRNGSSGAGGGSKSSSPPRGRRVRGFPTPVFVDAAQLGADPCLYDPNTNRLMINRDVGQVQHLLAEAEKKGARELSNVRTLIGAQAVGMFCEYVRVYNRIPSQEFLNAGLLANVAAALRVKRPNMIRLPRLKTSEQ